MRIERIDSKTVKLGPLDLLYCEFLNQIRAAADPGDSEVARQRLFPAPTTGKHAEIDRDWLEYVEPELADLFDSSLTIVEKDLNGFPPHSTEELGYSLRIPFSHLDAWIHALNQARLMLAERYKFTDDDMNGEIAIDGAERSLALFQEHFYGYIIECFVRLLNAEES
ncbi:MAG TPA: hypothetical protein VFG14_05515 [Chthoniobacteraceae bacterium]|nr:hypothetical protein [Chthoniobacteraceae bacterium]